MSRRLPAAALLAFAIFGSAASARTEPERTVPAVPAAITFAISGHGWGHGVGMGQYGAYGYAKHGWTYDRIVAHYYPGTELGPAPVSKVRVLIGEGKPRISITARAPFSARDSTGAVKRFNAGPVAVAVTGKNLVLPVTFLPGAAPLELDGSPYRGSLEISLAGKTLQVVDVVGIDKYLYGVVTSEMDSDWPAEALKAQAVAARSYALANRRSGSFDLYADTRSQAYGGLNAETTAARAAVDATARRVLTFDGQVADTFFSASSGGRTADATEVWSDKAIPYLASVPDPYDTLSPYHDWGPVVVTGEQVGKWLGVAGLQELTPVSGGPSGRARTVTASGVLGDVAVDGSTFRRALGLRSTWFTLGELALDRPAAPVVYGARGTLTGRVRGLPGAQLEQRSLGGSWQAGAVLAPAGDGSFIAVATPLVQTEYRLRSGTIVGQAVRFSVAPSLAVSPTADGTGIAGRVRPAVAGATVDLQRLTGRAWVSAVQATPDSAGRFSAAAAPGDYRIRYAPGGGLVAGTSPTVHVG